MRGFLLLLLLNFQAADAAENVLHSHLNVLVLIDTSSPMGAFANPFPPAYNPDITYDDSRYGFEAGAYYVFRAPLVDLTPDNTSPLDNKALFLDPQVADMLQDFRVESRVIRCGDTAQYLKTLNQQGFDFAREWAFWRPGQPDGQAYSPGKTDTGWSGPDKYIGYYHFYGEQDALPSVDSEPGHILQCALAGSQPYRYEEQNYRYMSYESGQQPYGNRAPHSSAYRYTQLMTGNYLNYLSVVTESRLDVFRRALLTALDQLENINVGLATFDTDSTGVGIDVAVQPVASAREAIRARLSRLSAWSGSPVAEGFYEMYLYLSGNPADYGLMSQDHLYFWGVFSRRYSAENSDPYFANGFQTGHGLTSREYDVNDPDAFTNPEEMTHYRAPAASATTPTRILYIAGSQNSTGSSKDREIRALVSGLNFKAPYLSEHCVTTDHSSQSCAEEILYLMANFDTRPELDGVQTITTDTILGLPSEHSTAAGPLLRQIAEAGKGRYYEAADFDALVDSIRQSLTRF